MVDVYRNVLGKCDYVSLYKYPHYGVPGHNLHDKIEVEYEDSSHGFPYNCMQPLPLLPPAKVSKRVLQGEDPAAVLVKKKHLWKYQIAVCKDRYKRQKKKNMVCEVLQDLISSNKRVQRVSCEDAYFVKIVARNPDEEFDGSYNWYYSEGCLDQLEMDGQVLLLTTQGKKKDELCVVPLEAKNNWKTLSSAASSVQPVYGHSIQQLRSACRQDTGFVGVRLRNVCHLYSLKPSLHLERMHEATSEHPFTGLDLSHHSDGTYCTVTTKRCVQEWDSNVRRPITFCVPTEENLADKWCSVSYCKDQHMIRMTDRCCTHFLDKRNDIRKSSLLLCPKKMPNILEHCETISLVFQSCILPHALYMCTSHHVLLYDIRAGLKPLQRWTHLLCSPPLYGCTVSPSSGEELVCIGNQEPGEIVTLLNSWNGNIPYSHVPPFALPNLHDALHSAHKHGLWLDPFTQHRVQLSLTGLVWLPPHASKLTLLSQTAAGDVFSHILKPRDLLQSNDREVCSVVMGNRTGHKNNVNSSSEIVNDYSKTRDLKCLANWEQQLLKRKASAVLKLTRRREMKPIYERLRSCGYRLNQDRKRRKKGGNKWMMSKQTMESCVDILAPRILAVWDIEKESEWYGGETAFQEDLSPSLHDKVQAWLTSVQNGEQNNVLHSELSEQEASSFNILNVSSEQASRQAKKSKAALNIPQSIKQSQTPRKDLPYELQNILTHSKIKFATSTPLSSLLKHVEGPTQDTFQILDIQANDTASQNISISQNQDIHDSVMCMRQTIQQSQGLSQDEECVILSQKNSKMKTDIKIRNNNAFIAGF